MKFLVTYWIHIIESQRPKDENFPTVFPINHVYEVQDDAGLGQAINDNYQNFIKSPGVTVYRDATSIRPHGTGNVENRIFICWNMIAYMNATIKQLVEQQEPDNTSLVPSEPEPGATLEVKGPVQ